MGVAALLDNGGGAIVDPQFWNALGLGLAFCASPGALNAEALRRGLARGFSSALRVEVGSLIGDGTWAVIGLSGAAYLAKYRPASVVLASLGSALLFWFAFHALRDAWARTRPPPRPESRHGDFAAGVIISLTNPYSVAFWMGLGGAVSVIGVRRKLRSTIKQAAPQAQEIISYRIPTFTLRGYLVHFAAFQDHVSLFPTSSPMKTFKKELSPYKVSKGTIQFPLDRPIPPQIHNFAVFRYPRVQPLCEVRW